MKKICFLIGNLNSSGGTERVTSIIANELSKQNYNVSILSLTDGRDPFFELQPAIQTYSLYPEKISFKKNFIGAVWKIRNFVKHNNIDTLIVVDSISCVFTVPALYGLNINHICWEHFNFKVDLGVYYRKLGRLLAARYCDYIVTLTERDKELWNEGLKILNSIIMPIPNPTPYTNVENEPNLNYKTILSVGRLTDQKGFDLLIEAWALVCHKNKEWVLRIVGSGEEEKTLKEQARKLKVNNHIDFVNSTQNVEQYYEISSFYCMSSRYEGLPMVLLEAQSYGLPIVAFNCDTGPSEVIENGVNGVLCESGNTKILAIALDNMINTNEENFRRMSDRSKLNSKNYMVEKIVEKWKSIL